MDVNVRVGSNPTECIFVSMLGNFQFIKDADYVSVVYVVYVTKIQLLDFFQ